MADKWTVDTLTADRAALLAALKDLLVGACAVGVPHAGERAVLEETVRLARAAIAQAERP